MANSKFRYFILHKPYGVLSQFTDKEGRKTLSDIYDFPKNIYPVGRLDMDSEGLLLLTDDKSLTNFLLNPLKNHEKEYFVQVENIPSEDELEKLREGIVIENKKTLPAKAKIIGDPEFPPRVPPVQFKNGFSYTWLSITLTEGRHRQVRKMTAAIGHPTMRLIRVRIKNLLLDGLKTGEARKLTESEIKELKK